MWIKTKIRKSSNSNQKFRSNISAHFQKPTIIICNFGLFFLPNNPSHSPFLSPNALTPGVTGIIGLVEANVGEWVCLGDKSHSLASLVAHVRPRFSRNKFASEMGSFGPFLSLDIRWAASCFSLVGIGHSFTDREAAGFDVDVVGKVCLGFPHSTVSPQAASTLPQVKWH